MKVYIDHEFHCHSTNLSGKYREVESVFFDGKCTTFIEGYRFKPSGETWIRSDGKVFSGGEMISPWKPYAELAAAQAQYKADLAAAATAYQEGVDSAYD